MGREGMPELPLHSSTQMTVHNLPGVQLMQQSGFDRVVLAREMDLKEIADIKKETGADLEVFVHGALCLCSFRPMSHVQPDWWTQRQPWQMRSTLQASVSTGGRRGKKPGRSS